MEEKSESGEKIDEGILNDWLRNAEDDIVLADAVVTDEE